jgi:Spy/CpxP family protein refolding chaperone
MILHRALAAAATASMMAVVAFAAEAPPTPACPPHASWAFMDSLTPEQRMMHFELMHQATANMTDDQRHAWRQAERAKYDAMPEADRQKYAAGLTTQWNALPADRKAAIQSEAEKRRAARPPRPEGCK